MNEQGDKYRGNHHLPWLEDINQRECDGEQWEDHSTDIEESEKYLNTIRTEVEIECEEWEEELTMSITY